MNLYGVVTGTNDYSLNVSFPNSFRLSVGDTITIRPLNANTGASTLDVGFGPMSLTLNGAALTNGQLEANKDRQCTFVGSGFALDNAGGGASFVGTSSNLTLGDGSAGIVPAGNFGNLSADEIIEALEHGSGTADQLVRGNGTLAALTNTDIVNAGGIVAIYHYQNSPQSVWTVNHNLGRLPAVTVIDSTNEVVFADIAHVSLSQFTVTFQAPLAGTVMMV